MRKAIKVIFLLLGIAIGLAHLQLAMRAIFVFREHEPWLSWAMVVSGPFLTLPAILIAIKCVRLAIWLLLFGGSMSLAFMIASEGVRGENVVAWLAFLSGPMFILAALGFLSLRYPIEQH